MDFHGINANYRRDRCITGKNTRANWSRVKFHYRANAFQGWSDPRKERDALQAPFLRFNTQLQPESRLFRRPGTTIKLYGAFNQITGCHGDIKIQECMEQGTAERGRSISMVCSFVHSECLMLCWWSNFRNSRMRLRTEKRRRRRSAVIKRNVFRY